MNWVDIVLLIALIIAAFFGFRIGIIKGALSLAGLILGVILAGRHYVALSEQLTFIPQAEVAKLVAFALILTGVSLIAAWLAWLLRHIVSIMMLGWVNRLGGAVFGFLLGAILCSAALAIWSRFLGAGAPITQSKLASLLLDRFPAVLALLPAEFDAIRAFFR